MRLQLKTTYLQSRRKLISFGNLYAIRIKNMLAKLTFIGIFVHSTKLKASDEIFIILEYVQRLLYAKI